MNQSQIITVLLGVSVLGALLFAIRLLEAQPEGAREELDSQD